MTKYDFVTGDVVKLRSGGLPMTVRTSVGVGENEIHVIWVTADGIGQEMIASKFCFIAAASADNES